MLQGWFMWFIVFWSVVMVGLMAIGGFFMFRKFFKKIPKADGMSDMDWELHYINETLHMWGDEQKEFLDDLCSPVPELFRAVAKQKIGAKIGQLALEENATAITEDLIIRGYILASPKRDHKFLRKKLNERKVDLTQYEQYFV